MSKYAPDSFKSNIFNDPKNRLLLCFAIAATIVQFITFKLLYPFPSFIKNDSYSYLEGAYYNLQINIYPIGYSKFLRLFHLFTSSDTALVAFQYASIQVTGLWLVFTLSYIFSIGTFAKYIMTIFVTFNPAHIYLSNYISSDALFLALSLCWFTFLIWFMHRPSLIIIVVQSLTLLLVFTVRFNALYYPIISLVALFISKQEIKNKLIGTALIVIPILIFMQQTSAAYKRLTGFAEFNPFAGWQIANNALDAYRYVEVRDRMPCPANLAALDSTVWRFFDKLNKMGSSAPHIPLNSTVYMWTPGLPLQDYMTKITAEGTPATYFKQWASMGPLYSEYGSFIISHYPATYLKFYL